mgnify:FL=1
MRKILFILVVAGVFMACGTKYDYIDTGVCEEEFRGNMYEYLQSNHYDWDSIVKIIDRAGLREMFEKEDFTFLGPTNITIRKWFVWDKIGGVGNTDKEYVVHGYKSIQRVPVEICRKIVLSHVIEEIVSCDDIARVTYNEEGKIDGGGDVFTTRWGNRVWLWTIQEPYMHIPEMGPVIVNMASVDNDGQKIKEIGTATIGVRPMNGMVHSLPYSYNLGEMYRDKYWAIVNH